MRTIVGLALALLALGCTTIANTESNETRSKRDLLEAREESGPKPEFPGEAAAWWARLHRTPDGEPAVQWNRMERERLIARERALGPVASLPNLAITDFGPGNFGGRLRGLVVKANDSNALLVGSVSGGIWRSLDGGVTWDALDDFLDSLAVGSMIADPDDANRVFVGTGEGFFNIDAQQGDGIFVTSDFGDTFTLLDGTNTANFRYVNRLVPVPGTNVLLAATRTGIWRTADFTNIAGNPWTEVSGFGVSSRGFVDLKLDPSTASPNARIYAFHYGSAAASRLVFRSANDGATWTALGAAEGIPTTTIGRMEIGVGTDGVVYLGVANSSDATRGLWRSPAGGAAFVKTTSTTAFIERQGWYDLTTAVKPGDSATVLMGAVDLYKTTNSGTTITKKTFWNPGVGQYPDFYIHADHHVVTFDPSDANTVYVGCDGGIFRSTDSGETWQELNNDLRVAQYYGIASNPDGSQAIGGTQDNGSHLYFGNKALWLEWAGGDGGFSAWDQQMPQFIYGATPQGGLFGSDDGGSTQVDLNVPGVTALFITPFTLDPNNGNRMIVGGSASVVAFSSNVRSLDSATFTDVFSSTTSGEVTAVTIDPHAGNRAYAGTAQGQVWRTTVLGIGTTWSNISTGLPTGSDVTSVIVDPHDVSGNTLYVTFADYGANRVWKSENAGASWSAIATGLPDVPTFTLLVDPLDSDRLFLGSELGLYTTDGNDTNSHSWQRYDYGVAWTRVVQLVAPSDNPNLMWIGTHGRGIYRADRRASVVELRGVDDSAAGCDADGSLDRSETAIVDFRVHNEGGADLTGASATFVSLRAGLTVGSGPIPLGTIGAGGHSDGAVTLSLATVTGCREMAEPEVTIDHDDGQEVHVVPLMVGTDPSTAPYVEDAESASTTLTSAAALGGGPWVRTSATAATGTFSWTAPEIDGHSDATLTTPMLTVGPGTTVLTFALRYDLEGDSSQFWDGMVLEMGDGEEWTDIGFLSTVPYDGTLFNNNTAPGRLAWSGTQLTWRNATVDLGATVNGLDIQFRFRLVSDTLFANPNGAAWIDDLAITNVTWPDCDPFGSCNAIFADGFESGNTSAWSAAVP